MDEHLIRALRTANPWLRGEPLGPWFERFLPVTYIPRRLRPRADHRVVLLVGPRQAGKSTLIWKTLAEDGRPALYLNCEDPSRLAFSAVAKLPPASARAHNAAARSRCLYVFRSRAALCSN